MGDFTRVKSPMKIHGRFYLSKKTPDYKMTHQLFTLFWIISIILTFHFYTFSVIYTFYFYITFKKLIFYQKCLIKCVLYSLFYAKNWRFSVWILFSKNFARVKKMTNIRYGNIWLIYVQYMIKINESPIYGGLEVIIRVKYNFAPCPSIHSLFSPCVTF